MTQALAPAAPPARSVADLHARFLDAPAASRRDTTALVVAAPDRVTLTRAKEAAALVVWLVGIYWTARLVLRGALHAYDWLADLFDSARDWCADTYTTLRARRGRT